MSEAVERLRVRLAEIDATDAGTPSRMAMFSPTDVREALAALTKPPEGEPVAWRRRGKNLRWEYLDDGSSSVVVSEWAPLYTRPVACPACYRGEVFGLATDDGFWVEMCASAGGAHEHGMNGWLELIEHHPDGTEKRREYVATDSPLYTRPVAWPDREAVIACIRDAADRAFEAGRQGDIHFRFGDIIARADALLSGGGE